MGTIARNSSRIDARTTPKSADLEAHVARVVAGWPPLTPDQLARVGVLLRPVGGASA